MREIYKIGTTVTEWGNSGKIVVPRSWVGKHVIAMLKSEWDDMFGRGEKSNDN